MFQHNAILPHPPTLQRCDISLPSKGKQAHCNNEHGSAKPFRCLDVLWYTGGAGVPILERGWRLRLDRSQSRRQRRAIRNQAVAQTAPETPRTRLQFTLLPNESDAVWGAGSCHRRVHRAHSLGAAARELRTQPTCLEASCIHAVWRAGSRRHQAHSRSRRSFDGAHTAGLFRRSYIHTAGGLRMSTTTTVMLSWLPRESAIFVSTDATVDSASLTVFDACSSLSNLEMAILHASSLVMTSHSPSDAKSNSWSSWLRISRVICTQKHTKQFADGSAAGCAQRAGRQKHRWPTLKPCKELPICTRGGGGASALSQAGTQPSRPLAAPAPAALAPPLQLLTARLRHPPFSPPACAPAPTHGPLAPPPLSQPACMAKLAQPDMRAAAPPAAPLGRQ
eukprot:360488-Chlamydomonas_euryale.AAC.15